MINGYERFFVYRDFHEWGFGIHFGHADFARAWAISYDFFCFHGTIIVKASR